MLSLIFMIFLGVFFAILLIIADKTFYVKEDPRLEKVVSILPGVNCGACGFPSCEAYAKGMCGGETAPGLCSIGGDEVNLKIAKILGVSMESQDKKVAILRCNVDGETRKILASYKGSPSCLASNLTQGGGMACSYGCLGFGDCVKVCPVEAIKIVKGKPVVDYEKCIGCGKCVEACPRGLFELVPYIKPLICVACNNTEPGRKVRAVCSVGCIACKICEKLSSGAFQVNNNL
ncbi:MAG: RnfABCDGE type electron transport complex subunit B, partial [Caldiserica bacterium]|nr:RnfABCDGE type electron transport complex subunit B [Caldisericota bacterium]